MFLLLYATVSIVGFKPWYLFFNNFMVFGALIFFMLALIIKFKSIEIPFIFLFFLMISFVPLFQYYFGLIYFFSTAFLSFCYLFLFFITSVIFYNLFKGNNGFKELNIIIFILIIFSLFHCLSSFLQWLNLDVYSNIFLKNDTKRVFGNIAQPNNLSSLILISLVGLIFWFENNFINKKIFYALNFTFLFTIALTQSRAGILFFILMMIYFFLFRKRFININSKYILLSSVFFVLLNLFLPNIQNLIGIFFGVEFLSEQSLIERSKVENTRFEVWSFFIDIIHNMPFWGYGWYQTQVAQYQNFKTLQGVFVSSHNLFLDIIIWNGYFLSILIFGIILIFLFKIIKSLKCKNDYILIMVLMVLVNHSLFEFPLYYPYFIVIFSIFLSYLLCQIELKSFKVYRFLNISLIVLIASIMIVIWSDYSEYNEKKIYASNSGMGFSQDYSVDVEILDTLEADLYLISINKFEKVSDADIYRIEKIVSSNMNFYNLLKFCQILYNNNKGEKMDKTIHKLKVLYGYDVDKGELMQLKL